MMLAFHNDPAIKAKYEKQVQEHREADAIIKGQYWSEGRGCAVGGTIHGSDHNKYETALGIPRQLAHIEDDLFEAMPLENAIEWPGKFLAAIPVGSDLSLVGKRWLAWVIRDLLNIPELAAGVAAAVRRMADLMDRSIAGDEPSETEWSEAAQAARDFLEANGKGDWNAVAQFWPANVPA